MKFLISTAMAIAVWGAVSSPALAQSPMSELDRETLQAEIRSYLLENPEILVEMSNLLQQKEALAAKEREENALAELSNDIFEDGYSYVGGNLEGSVTIVEFLDYRCGFCRRAHPYVNDIVNTDGDIRYIIKEYPVLGQESVLASAAAIAVLKSEGPEAYKTFSDTLMSWGGPVNQNSLNRIAQTAGVDIDAMTAGMATSEVRDIVNKNRDLAAKLDITGTPTFIIGDQIVRGALPRENLEQVIALIREREK